MELQPRPGAAAEKRRVDGIVLIDKPLRMSSNAALQRVKRAFRARKAGHTGTLDPLATGLLPICLGEATKFSQRLLDSDKVYRTDVRLGVVTETGDVEGRVVRERPVEVSREDVDRILARFRGSIEQVPHRYSALKRQGRRLYDYARAGEPLSIAPRSVRIEELEIEEWSLPWLRLRVRCSKGTYVRSLAEDVGEALGCGAHVATLRRISSGRFDVADALDVEALEALSEPDRDALVLPVSALIADLPSVALRKDVAVRFSQGLPVDSEVDVQAHVDSGRLVAVFVDSNGKKTSEFIGVGRHETREGNRMLIPVRLLESRDRQAASPMGE